VPRARAESICFPENPIEEELQANWECERRVQTDCTDGEDATDGDENGKNERAEGGIDG